ncbi:uncharacterized protein LOC121999522, partial [Zingiber officinale]|uniref:uncharacterized protein LOC121999522 n=1 Tax=Zingiber officinale TaxID=94328 RepID=UPI001C4B5A5A
QFLAESVPRRSPSRPRDSPRRELPRRDELSQAPSLGETSSRSPRPPANLGPLLPCPPSSRPKLPATKLPATSALAAPSLEPPSLAATKLGFPRASLAATRDVDARRALPLAVLTCRSMADSSSRSLPSKNNSAVEEEPKLELLKKIRRHEVAISELNHLQPSRTVYQQNCNIFFRKTIKTVMASEQKHLDLAKAQLQEFDAVLKQPQKQK